MANAWNGGYFLGGVMVVDPKVDPGDLFERKDIITINTAQWEKLKPSQEMGMHILIHELAHFCGEPPEELKLVIPDLVYGAPEDYWMKTLKPYQKLQNADCYAGFAREALNGIHGRPSWMKAGKKGSGLWLDLEFWPCLLRLALYGDSAYTNRARRAVLHGARWKGLTNAEIPGSRQLQPRGTARAGARQSFGPQIRTEHECEEPQGKLESFYFSFGPQEVVMIVDLPDNVSAAALTMAANMSGAVNVETTPLLTVEEMDAAIALPTKYRAPGDEK